MGHPFGDLLSQYLHRKHGLSQSKLAAGILQAPTVITGMCKGRRLTGPQARERVVAIIGWLHQQGVLASRAEADALLTAAGMSPLQMHKAEEAALLRALPDTGISTGTLAVQPSGSHFEQRSTIRVTTQENNRSNSMAGAAFEKTSNLPTQLTPLVGRTAEMAELAALLADPAVRLLTLYGPGGIGKTRLALEVASALEDRFGHGVYFVSLASVDTAYALIPLIAEVFNFSFFSEGTPRQQLCHYLRSKHVLLVLDNFEHLIGDVAPPDLPELDSIALLVDLLQCTPRLKILVTSRIRLNVQGEQLYAIDGIDFPQSNEMTLAAARQSSAVALFVQSARRVQPDFDLTEANAADIIRICRLVQGMPLAILLAAAWVTVLPPTEILAKLNPQEAVYESLDFLEAEWRDVPARQRSLRAVFDHSWWLLSETEQSVFAQLSVFRSGFTRQSLERIYVDYRGKSSLVGIEPEGNVLTANPDLVAQLPNLLRALLNKSLIRRREDGNGGWRYDLHELLRQYAVNRLAQMPDKGERVRVRHCHFYCGLVREQESRLKGTEQKEALALIELELENVRAAWRRALVRGQFEPLAQAIQGMGYFYEWRNRYAEGEAAFSNTVHQLWSQQHNTPIAKQVLAQALAWQAVFCRLLRRMEESRRLLQESLDVLNNSNLPAPERQRLQAFILLQLGRLCEAQVESAQSEMYYRQALALYEALAEHWGQANVLSGLGNIAYRTGDFDKARRCYEASLARFEMTGDESGSAYVLERLSYIHRDQGEFESARQLIAESLARYEKSGDRAKIAQGRFASAWHSVFEGEFDKAHVVVQECAAIFEELGLPAQLIPPRLVLAVINLELGRYEEVSVLAQSSHEHGRRTGNRNELAFAKLLLAYLAIVEQRYSEVEQLARECAAFYQEFHDTDRLALAVAAQGYALRGLGRLSTARQCFMETLQSAVTLHSIISLAFAVPGIALLLADQGEAEEAVELYAAISTLGFVANSQLRRDMVGRHIESVAATLLPEVATAARARGRGADLWATAAALLSRHGMPSQIE